MRKAHYSLNLKLKKNEESSALAFGSAIHKALEHWYLLPTEERELPSSSYEAADQLAFGHGLDTECTGGALEAIRQFCKARFGVLSLLPEDDKRSLQSGVRILKAYFKHYAKDGFEVLRDESGPVIERLCEKLLYDSPALKITYFGTIDVVLKHRTSGVIAVCDHKTTWALGKEFYDRCKPNHQYTGYVWLAKESLGIDTNLFLINGIQTAKTKTEFARQMTERTEDDFNELKEAVIAVSARWATSSYLDGVLGFSSSSVSNYPMTAPGPCSNYGGCQYRTLCELPASMRANAIKALY